jgi:hypothetical protein
MMERGGNRWPFLSGFRGGRAGGPGCGEPGAELEELLAQAALFLPSRELRGLPGELQADCGEEALLEVSDGGLVLGDLGFGFRRFAGGFRELREQLEVFGSERGGESSVISVLDSLIEGVPQLARGSERVGPLWLVEGEKLGAFGSELRALGSNFSGDALDEGVLDAESLSVLSAHLLEPSAECEQLLTSRLEFGEQGPFPPVSLFEEPYGGETPLDVDRGSAAPAGMDDRDCAWRAGHVVGGSGSYPWIY